MEYELVNLADKSDAPFKEKLLRKNMLDVVLNRLSAEYCKLVSLRLKQHVGARVQRGLARRRARGGHSQAATQEGLRLC